MFSTTLAWRYLLFSAHRYNNNIKSAVTARDKRLQLNQKGMSKRKAEETEGETMAATSEKLPQVSKRTKQKRTTEQIMKFPLLMIHRMTLPLVWRIQ